MEALGRYPFPGNVRELENILERALAMSEGHSIEIDDLYLPQAPAGKKFGGDFSPGEVIRDAPGALDVDPAAGALPDYIEQLERAAIQKALEENRWNKTKAAAQLGITFRALRYKLKKLGME